MSALRFAIEDIARRLHGWFMYAVDSADDYLMGRKCPPEQEQNDE